MQERDDLPGSLFAQVTRDFEDGAGLAVEGQNRHALDAKRMSLIMRFRRKLVRIGTRLDLIGATLKRRGGDQ